jgi:hypothetical protein
MAARVENLRDLLKAIELTHEVQAEDKMTMKKLEADPNDCTGSYSPTLAARTCRIWIARTIRKAPRINRREGSLAEPMRVRTDAKKVPKLCGMTRAFVWMAERAP